MAAAKANVCRNAEDGTRGAQWLAEVYAEVVHAEVCGNADRCHVTAWNHSGKVFAEVIAEVCGKGGANPLISLGAEVPPALYKGRRQASPASLRSAALPCIDVAVFETSYENGHDALGHFRARGRRAVLSRRPIPLDHYARNLP